MFDGPLIGDGYGFKPTVRMLTYSMGPIRRRKIGRASVVEHQERIDFLFDPVRWEQIANRKSIPDPVIRTGPEYSQHLLGLSPGSWSISLSSRAWYSRDALAVFIRKSVRALAQFA